MDDQWLHGFVSGVGCWLCWRVLLHFWRVWAGAFDQRPYGPDHFHASAPDDE